MRLVYWCCIALSATGLMGATYYVDYDNGSNTNNGTSQGAPWKHAPGDPSATGNADRTPAAGDVILFKGGVHYKGKLNINFNGASGNPITYKGNGWGTEKAVIDGSEPVTDWTKCTSASQCGGNSNYANIWVANMPTGVTALEANLFQGDSLLQCAQYPNLKDIFWMDDRSTYLTAQSANGLALISSDLTAIGNTITMGYVYLDRSGNDVDALKITSYNGSTTIGHESTSRTPTGKFAIANVISDVVFDRAGEYVVDETARKIYLWPWDGTDPNTVTITASVRQEVVQYNGSDNITFEGIRVIKTCGKVSYANGNTNLTIKDCDFHHCRSRGIDNTLDLVNQNGLLVDGCSFWRNARMRGVVGRRSGGTHANCTVTNNRFVKMGRTGVFLYEVNGGKINHNYIADGKGVHSNALSCYSDHSSDPCRNIEVKYNISLNSNNCLTFYGVSKMDIINNLFDGSAVDYPVACWNSANSIDVTFYHNHLINSGSKREGFFALPDGSANMPTLMMRNNIVDGLKEMNGDVSHHLYTTYAPNKTVTIGPNDKLDIRGMNNFTDWSTGDWTLKAGAWAIDAGENVGITNDVNGDARPYGSAPDIGCYEWSPTGIAHPGENDLYLGGLVIPSPVRALAGAIIIKRAVLEQGEAVRLVNMVGHKVSEFNSLKAGFYLLKHGEKLQKIMVVD